MAERQEQKKANKLKMATSCVEFLALHTADPEIFSRLGILTNHKEMSIKRPGIIVSCVAFPFYYSCVKDYARSLGNYAE